MYTTIVAFPDSFLEVLEVDILWPRWVARIGVVSICYTYIVSLIQPLLRGLTKQGACGMGEWRSRRERSHASTVGLPSV